ncbi:hypothetical protein [Streptomyces sp. NPDC090445]|uniref:hypothetical protein n=1 Tax=Streptomyces sp. NPDC090445 TaxID=3365963 RepID=UPI0037F43441
MSRERRVPPVPLSEATAGRVSRMCADLAELEDLLGDGARPLLARLRAPGASEEQVGSVLAELEDLLRRHGVVGSGGVARGPAEPGPGPDYRPLPGLGRARPQEVVLICPGGLCDRVEIPRAGTAAPGCAVWATGLSRFRMDRP